MKNRLSRLSVLSQRKTLMRRFSLAVATVLSVAFGVSASVASAGVLNVSVVGSGTGTVTSSPAGIECSNVPGSTQTACSYDYGFSFDFGTLTATPAEGSAFVSWSGTGGGTCVGAANPCVTGILLLDMSVTATFAPKPDAPSVTTGAASDIAFPSATVNGTVNPGSDDFAVSDCYFEYGLTTDYGEKSLCRPMSIGTGTSPVAVNASIGVLGPGKQYHYRLVAKNGGGTTHGEDQTLTSGAAPADDCANADIRALQGALAQRLPNCGAYELISPPFTAGQAVGALAGTADGDRAMLTSAGGFAGTENLPDTGIEYATERTDSGWNTSAIAPPASAFPYTFGALDWTRDGRRSLWFLNLKADEGTNRFTPVARDPDGSFHVAGPTQNEKSSIPGATSEDLRTVVQRTLTRPALTDGTVDSRSSSVRSVYASTRGADGQLSVRQVAYRDGATMFPNCAVELGGVDGGGSSLDARNVVSRDGLRVFFTTGRKQFGEEDPACVEPAARRVWAKVGNAEPIDLSASQCPATCGAEATANFRGASRDGSRVYFTTEQALLPEDQDASSQNDLYEYDFNATGNKLRLVTGGTGPEGAGVSVAGSIRTSADGAYVYFMATGRALAESNARGVAPQPGDNNLYVYHRPAGQASGTTTFIGALTSLNEQAAQVSSTGRFFLLQSTANLTGERVAGDGHADLYRYDSQDDELLRVWASDAEHNGPARVAGAIMEGGGRSIDASPSPASQRGGSGEWSPWLQVSDDGSIVGFTTAEPLSRDDRNTDADAYLWEASTGRLTLLTTGTSTPGNRYVGSQFTGMTPSGESLYVTSASPLLREHTSGQGAAYVIRRGGGFPEAPAPDPPCVGDKCQGPPSPSPPGLGPAGSSTFAGSGNALLATRISPATVRVGKVRAVRGSSTRIAVKVSGRGKIRASGSNLVRTSRSVDKAGSYRLAIKLSKKARRTLQRKQRLKVRVSVRFVPKEGKAVVARASVTFISKAKGRVSPREPGVLLSGVRKGR